METGEKVTDLNSNCYSAAEKIKCNCIYSIEWIEYYRQIPFELNDEVKGKIKFNYVLITCTCEALAFHINKDEKPF